MKKKLLKILVAYLVICAFFYWFNRRFYNEGDSATETFIRFIDPLGSYVRHRYDGVDF